MSFLKIIATLFIVLSPVASGKATRYNPGVMGEVVQNRIGWGQLDLNQPNMGYVALADCGYLNQRVVIELSDGKFVGPYLVTDCGAAQDQEHLKDIGFAVDLSWEVAQQLGVTDAPLKGVRVYEYLVGSSEVQKVAGSRSSVGIVRHVGGQGYRPSWRRDMLCRPQ
jgi:hypothetical protein